MYTYTRKIQHYAIKHIHSQSQAITLFLRKIMLTERTTRSLAGGRGSSRESPRSAESWSCSPTVASQRPTGLFRCAARWAGRSGTREASARATVELAAPPALSVPAGGSSVVPPETQRGCPEPPRTPASVACPDVDSPPQRRKRPEATRAQALRAEAAECRTDSRLLFSLALPGPAKAPTAPAHAMPAAHNPKLTVEAPPTGPQRFLAYQRNSELASRHRRVPARLELHTDKVNPNPAADTEAHTEAETQAETEAETDRQTEDEEGP